ncbi:MAG: C-type lectin domain-containing protein [Myxococcales bacterium]|nr:C-type lectin domain-containing protein [Myxococcales bacterium]
MWRDRRFRVNFADFAMLVALGGTLALAGCAGEDTGLTCGADTEAKSGKCVAKASTVVALACGAGTVEKEGKCVPATPGSTLACGAGTSEKDGKCVAPTPGATIACGAGTMEKEGKCIVDTAALMPKVSKVVVKQLGVQGDGVRQLMVLHDVRVTAEFEIVGEAFESMMVVGVRNADKTKTCTLGYWQIQQKATKDDAATTGVSDTNKSITGIYKFESNFVVQPGCKGLIGEKGLIAWAAFDPFQSTNYAERKASPLAAAPAGTTPEQQIAKLFGENEQPLTSCKAGPTSTHPDNCTTSLEVVDSAGIDLRMEHMNTSTSVVVLEYAGEVPPAAGATDTTVAGIKVKAGAVDWSKLKPPAATSPALSVNTQLVAFGLKPGAKDKFSNDDFGLTFGVRPVGAGSEEWVAMTEKVEQASKAGEQPTVEYLEKVFLQGMVAETRYIKESPVYFTQKAKDQVTTGKWSNQAFFDLKICADGPFAEGGVDADPKVNNCNVTQFVLVRHKRSYIANPGDIGASSGTAAKPTSAIKLDEFGPSKTWGNASKVALEMSMKLFREWNSDKRAMRLGARKGTYIKGWIPVTIIEEKAWLEIGTKSADSVAGQLTIFNIALPTPAITTPESFELMIGGVSFKTTGDVTVYPPLPSAISKAMSTLEDALKKEKSWSKFVTFPIWGPLDITVGIGVGISASLDLGVKKESEDDTDQDCDATAGTSCYKAIKKTAPEAQNYDTAKKTCLDDGGKLPSEHASFDHVNALINVANKIGYGFWLGVRATHGTNWAVEYDNGWQPNSPKWMSTHMINGIGQCGTMNTTAGGTDQVNAGNLPGAWVNNSFFSFPCHWVTTVVCEYPKAAPNSEDSEVYAVIEPNFKVDATGYAGLSLKVVRGGVYVTLDLVKGALPLEGGLKWKSASGAPNASGAFFVRLKAVLSTLNGEVGPWYETWTPFSWNGQNKFKLFGWTGFESTETLFETEFAGFNY